MNPTKRISRRRLLGASAFAAIGAGANLILPRPLWARSVSPSAALLANPKRELTIGPTSINFGGRGAAANGINGSVPGPLLRWREGDDIDLLVRNELNEQSSIHWHGLLLPSNMDGVPGLSFAGIEPGGEYRYRFKLRQNGTYWYHSHSGFQEQTGVYGPIIIDPKDEDPIESDREFILLLSDWTFEDPNRLLNNLKVRDDYYNYNRRTFGEFVRDARRDGWLATMADRRMWGNMRMKASDIADITAATYTYLLNGMDAAQNWTGVFAPGDRVRLRIINGSAQTFFNVRIPGLEMTVVQTDGQYVEPVKTDEIQIGVAETYDVVINPKGSQAYTFFAETMDRSGFARGTLTPRAGLQAAVPALRPSPRVTMRDMGMNHGSMDHGGMDHGSMDHGATDHDSMDHDSIGHGAMDHGAMADSGADTGRPRRGPGVANVVANPMSRLDEPGQGLADVPHRVLRYSQLRALTPNADNRRPERELTLHLTGNMERYMWSFDGVKYSEVDGPIRLSYNERVRLVLINNTMMSHPIHLHGMFVELVNGNGPHNPRKHTVVVKPAERLALDLTANEPGHWAFHCHMLYHMKAGMMRSILVADRPEESTS